MLLVTVSKCDFLTLLLDRGREGDCSNVFHIASMVREREIGRVALVSFTLLLWSLPLLLLDSVFLTFFQFLLH